MVPADAAVLASGVRELGGRQLAAWVAWWKS